MATLKMIGCCHPTKKGKYTSLKNCLNYITDERKTLDKKLILSQNCTTDNTFQDFIDTKKFYGHISDSEKDRQAYHWVISFSPEEVINYDTALQVAKDFCEKCLKDYECILACHIDKAHIHVHIVFNSTELSSGKKFRYNNGEWAKYYQPYLDNICKGYNLHILQDYTGISNNEYYNKHIKKSKKYYQFKNAANNKKYYNEKEEIYSNSDLIKKDIDDAILISNNLEEFFTILKNNGYDIRQGHSQNYGDYFSIKGKGMSRARRNYKLGLDYSITSIIKRINMKNQPLPEYEAPEDFRKYIVNYEYWHKPDYSNLTSMQRAYNYMIYNTGIDKGKKYNYHDIKKHLQNIKKLDQELDIINEYKISDETSAKNTLVNFNQSLVNSENKIKEFFKQKRIYNDLLNTYKQKKNIESQFYMYKNGKSEYKQYYEEYIQLNNKLKKYGFTDFEIEKFQISTKEEYKKLKNEEKLIKQKIELINSIIDRLINNRIPDISVEQYKQIPEPQISYYQNKNITKKIDKKR